MGVHAETEFALEGWRGRNPFRVVVKMGADPR
jgi:hypothetical protein